MVTVSTIWYFGMKIGMQEIPMTGMGITTVDTVQTIPILTQIEVTITLSLIPYSSLMMVIHLTVLRSLI